MLEGATLGTTPVQASAGRRGALVSPRSEAEARSFMLPLTLFALVIRLTVALVIARTSSAQWLFSQATELGCMADSFNHGYGLSSPFCGHTGPSAFLAPGYPLFVAAVFRVFGAFTMRAAVCIVFTQALLATAMVPVAMSAARRAFGQRVSNLTGLLCAINPWLIGLEAVLWETSLSILLMSALVGFAIALQRKFSRGCLYGACMVLTLAGWVNPSLLLAGVVLLLVAFLLGPRQHRSRWILPALLFCAVSSLWPARNLRVLHAFVPMRSNMGYELWQGNHAGADGFFEAKLHPNVNAQEYEHYKALGEIGYMQEKSMLTKAWICQNPGRFLQLTLKRAACFWTGVGRTPSGLLILSTAMLSMAGLGALFVLLRANWKLAALFAVPCGLLPLPYYLAHPDFRFWCLLAPTLSMLTAWWVLRTRGKAN